MAGTHAISVDADIICYFHNYWSQRSWLYLTGYIHGLPVGMTVANNFNKINLDIKVPDATS